jgi:hypothetical protein
MARTEAGAALTERNRALQLQVRNATLRDFRTLWPLWNGNSETFDRLVRATMPLVQSRRSVSAGLAVDYYQAFRFAEGESGTVSFPASTRVDPERVQTSLRVTAREQVRRSLAAGFPPQAAMQTAFVTTSGAVTRHVLDGGRQTLLDAIREDNQAFGYERITDGAPCDFCAMLGSRGAVYKSEATGGFRSHDHCGCTVAPRLLGDEFMTPRNRRFHELWNESTRGTRNSTEARRAFRRALEAA